MEWAIIATGGKQYRVSPGQIITVPRIKPDPEQEEMVSFTTVLLKAEGDSLQELGAPELKGAVVTARYLGAVRTKKVRTMRFKAKTRARTARGSRDVLARVRIEAIK